MAILKSLTQKIVGWFGLRLVRKETNLSEFDPNFAAVYKLCRPYTMTSVERMFALYKSVEYIINNNIAGDFVECGVWRGGSAMVVAHTLLQLKVKNRHLYLYDTYEGMSAPTEKDKDFEGNNAAQLLKNTVADKENSVWCLADLADVQKNLHSTAYPPELIHFIKGKVEDTIPLQIPNNQLAILRLDTDWYESTRHELIHLYPLLTTKGVLIIDDYGYWQGAKMAVDEYFSKENNSVLLNRVDGTGRVAIKI